MCPDINFKQQAIILFTIKDIAMVASHMHSIK